ncbi:MAG: transporter substrate-binding domain-containing protein [Deltaproteobacteria bacterium]|nr:transporter substrate-binding domain-containing protein [Deltaproteobacteria bacterium]
MSYRTPLVTLVLVCLGTASLDARAADVEAPDPEITQVAPAAPPEAPVAIDDEATAMEAALTAHKSEPSTGDLDELKRRGSIRVLVRNNATSFFLYKGIQQGFDFELVKAFAAKHHLRVDTVVPDEASELIPWLLEGRADLVAAGMSVTPERSARVAFSRPYLHVDEVLVQPAGEAPVTRAEDLRGRAIHVRRSSSYRATLEPLAAQHGFTLVDAPEDVETEELIARVASGVVPLTVADSTIAATELAASKGAKATLVLQRGVPVAFATRPDAALLRAALDAFVQKDARTVARLHKKYFARPTKNAPSQRDVRTTGAISKWDPLIKKYSARYGIDWRLMAAQAYQESFFDEHAESWCGALGLFQVMPKTGRALGFRDVRPPETSIHAGIKYMAQLIGGFEPELPFKQRVRFALASYNAGPHHVADARMLAKEMGLDPNKWFGHVEQAMLRLEDRKVARRRPHGFCRGSEPVKYVSDIQSRYDNWVSVFPLVDEKGAPAR